MVERYVCLRCGHEEPVPLECSKCGCGAFVIKEDAPPNPVEEWEYGEE